MKLKNIFKAVLMGVFILMSFIALGQVDSTDSTGTGGIPGEFELNPTVVLVLSAILGIYEVLARLIPTVKNYSILGWLIKLIQLLIPNRAKPEAVEVFKEKVVDPNKTTPPALP